MNKILLVTLIVLILFTIVLIMTFPSTTIYQKVETTNVIEVNGIVTYYTASVDETDDRPWETASGATVRLGYVANNCLDFETRILIEGRVYWVMDRLNKRYDCTHFDIFVESKEQAFLLGKRELIVKVYE